MDTVIENWFIVELYTDKSAEENQPLNISLLWGIVAEDFRMKIKCGDFVCTSNIAERIDENNFRTKSGTFYEVIGPGQVVKIHANDLPKLMSGFSPLEIISAKHQGGSLVNASYH